MAGSGLGFEFMLLVVVLNFKPVSNRKQTMLGWSLELFKNSSQRIEKVIGN